MLQRYLLAIHSRRRNTPKIIKPPPYTNKPLQPKILNLNLNRPRSKPQLEKATLHNTSRTLSKNPKPLHHVLPLIKKAVGVGLGFSALSLNMV